MRFCITLVTLAAALILPTTSAFAYVGPGAGLSLLGALWALIAAVGTAFVFLVAWPVRRLLRKGRGRSDPHSRDSGQERAKEPADSTAAPARHPE